MITISKEEAIQELQKIRQQIAASGANLDVFKHLAEQESDCSR